MITNSPVINDYSVANIGQLKWVATQAKAEMDANLPGGCGSVISNLVASFTNPNANNYAVANVGQVKNIAAPFYDRLIAFGLATNYPWAGATNPPNDFALANIGQLKYLFAFSPAAGNFFASLPFIELFEPNTVHLGDINDQNGWIAGTTNTAFVQNTTVYADSQALQLNGGTSTIVSVSHAFTNSGIGTVWIDCYMIAEAANSNLNTDTTSAGGLFFNTNGQLVVHDGLQPACQQWMTLTNRVPLGFWTRITICADYLAQRWLVYLNGRKVIGNLGFATASSSFQELSLKGMHGFVDNVSVSSNAPTDSAFYIVTIPDWWEMQYFGNSNQADSDDFDGDGFSNLQEYLLGSDPTNTASHPCTISGTITYTGPQTGTIYVIASATSNGWDAISSTNIAAPGPYTITLLPPNSNYWLKAWCDSAGVGTNLFWEAQGTCSNNPIYLTNNAVCQNIALTDPDTDNDGLPDWWELKYFGNLDQKGSDDFDQDNYSNLQEYLLGTDPTNALSHPLTISGTIVYTGPQTGTIHVIASATSNGWDAVSSTNIAAPGAYTISLLPPNSNNWVKAWRDSAGCGTNLFWEAQGTCSNNPIYLTSNAVNQTIILTDPDTDSDGLPDWWEMKYFGNLGQKGSDDSDQDNYSNLQEYLLGTDPTNALSHPLTISGNIVYNGPQTGTIHVIASATSNGWDAVSSTNIAAPGAYTISLLPPNSSYWLKAWCDSAGCGTNLFWEAQGSCSNNPIYLINNAVCQDITLLDPDTDSDGLPDWWEMKYFGNLAQPGADDIDHDGLSNLQKYQWGLDPTVSNACARLPFIEMFEPNTVQLGDVNTQNGWIARASNTVFVQTNTIYAGAQALHLNGGSSTVSVSHVFNATSATNVWIDLYMIANAADLRAADNSAFVGGLFFNTNGQLVVHDGLQPAGQQWVTLTNSVSLGSWVRVTICADYAAQRWLVYLNGYKVVGGLGFVVSNTNFQMLAMQGAQGFADNVTVSSNAPADSAFFIDTIPDWWELQHFGNSNQPNSGDPDQDGLSNLQEYLFGTNPNCADANALDYLAIYAYLYGNTSSPASSIPYPHILVVTNGFGTIQDAINRATNDYDIVALTPGVYTSVTSVASAPNNVNLNFAGNAANPKSRNNKMMLIGLGTPNNPVIIDLGKSSATGLICNSNETPDHVISGITFQNGNGAVCGGGITCMGSSPTIMGCTFSNISSSCGGAIYSSGGNPTIYSCQFFNNGTNSVNFASAQGGAVYVANGTLAITNSLFSGNIASNGGAIYCASNSLALFANCSICSNQGVGASLQPSGAGGVEVVGSASIQNCQIFNNTGACGAGVRVEAGGSLSMNTVQVSGNLGGSGGALAVPGGFSAGAGGIEVAGSANLQNCQIANNMGDFGAGVRVEAGGSLTMTNAQITGNLAQSGGGLEFESGSAGQIASCAFTGNGARYFGGAISGNGATVNLAQCSFVENTARMNGSVAYFAGGGCLTLINGYAAQNFNVNNSTIYLNQLASALVQNCTFVSNTIYAAFSGGGMLYNYQNTNLLVCNSILWGNTGTQIVNDANNSTNQAAQVVSCCIQGGYTNASTANVITTDPLLSDGYHLLNAASPCVNRGSPVGLPAIDIDGNTRIYCDIGCSAFPWDLTGILPSSRQSQTLPGVQLSGTAGDGSALLSWTYAQTNAGANLADNVGTVTLYKTNAVGGNILSQQVSSSQNWYNWTGLTNNQSCTFWVTIVSKDGTLTNQSNAVTLSPQTGALTSLPDVTALCGINDSTNGYISWQFDPTQTANANAIGFLVFRAQYSTPQLVAALPVSTNKHYAFVDPTGGGASETYMINVIDAQNRRSPGAQVSLGAVVGGQNPQTLGMIQALFLSGQPPQHASGGDWPGVWSGVFNGAINVPPVGYSTATNSSNQVVLFDPAQSSNQQFFQSLLPQNEVLSASFGLQIAGANPTNAGVTVLKVKPLNSGVNQGAVCPVTIYQDKIYVGDFCGQFYHGGIQHNYTIVWSDSTHLYIDGNEVVLTSAVNVSDSQEAGDAFVRFGAQSAATNLVTVWDHIALLPGITGYFPMGGLWLDTTIPGAVTNLQIVNTSPNQVTATWSPNTATNLAAYRVTVNGLNGYQVFVQASSAAPTATISLPIPGAYSLFVQAVDFYGNMSATGQSVAFLVSAPVSGSASTYTTSLTGGFTATNSSKLASLQGAWLNFTNGATYRLSSALSGAQWGLELDFAISPAIVTNGGYAHPVMTQADILQLLYPGASYLLSILPESVTLGGVPLTPGPMALGGSEHVIRLINDGVGLYVGLDGNYVTTLAPQSITNLFIGDLNTNRTSKLNLKRITLLTGGTTAANMLALTNSLTPTPVPELTLDVSRCSNTNGLALAWLTPDPSVTLLDILYLPRRSFEAGYPQTNAVMPVQYLQNGQFIANTMVQQTNDGDPGQVILKVVPHNMSGGTGKGTARMFTENYPRTNGVLVTNLANIATGTLPFPSFVTPSYRLMTGGDSNLIVNSQIAADAFVSIPQHVCLTNNWDFEGNIIFGSFRGTLFAANPLTGTPITLTYDGAAISLGTQRVTLSSNALHHLRATFVNVMNTNGNYMGDGIVSLYLDNATVPVKSNVLVTAKFGTNSVLQFGNLSYSTTNTPLTLQPLSWSAVSVATTMSMASTNWNAPLLMSSNAASVTSVWNYVTTPTEPVIAPTPQQVPALSVVYLQTLPGQPTTVLTNGNGATLTNSWTLQFLAYVGATGNQFIVNSCDATVTITPTMQSPNNGWAIYRVVHTPEATTLFVNGSLDFLDVTCVPRTNATCDVKIAQAAGGVMTFQNLTLLNGAIDDTTGLLSPIHRLFYTEIACTNSPNSQGLALTTNSLMLFADTALSDPTTNYFWAFNGTNANSIFPFAANAQVTNVYTPGSYGVTLLNCQTNPLASIDSVPVSAYWPPIGQYVAPMNLLCTPNATGFTLNWTPALNQTPDCYHLQLTDPDTGNITNCDVCPGSLPLTITLPPDERGQNLTLSLYAEQLLNGVPVLRSPALTQTVASYDTHSVILIPNQKPTIAAVAGDGSATLTIDHQPNDLQGYVLWQNNPGDTNGADAVPIKLISKLGVNAVAQINALGSAASMHPFLNTTQKGELANIPAQDITSEPVNALSLFFFNDQKGPVTVPIGNLNNAKRGNVNPYTFTLDPYDDALPAPPGSVPPPNLGSRESGNNNIPATNVNTVSIQVAPLSQLPTFNGSALLLSQTLSGPVILQTVANLSTNIPAWIQNALDPLQILIPASWSNTTIYFTGPLAADPALNIANVAIIGPHGERTSVAVFNTSIDFSQPTQPLVLPPFFYNAKAGCIDLPIAGSFVCGQALLNGANKFSFTIGDMYGGLATSNATLVVSQNGTNIVSDQTSVLYCQTAPQIQVLSPAANAVLNNVSNLVINGTYNSPAGIHNVAVSINGVNYSINTNSSSVGNGTFWIQLVSPPVNGSNNLIVSMTDLGGNVATSATVSFTFLANPVTIQPQLQFDGTNLWFSATLAGLGANNTAPILTTLDLNGLPIALTNNANFTRSGAIAVLTNQLVAAHSGDNIFMLNAGISLGVTGQVNFTVSGAADLYLNQPGTNSPPMLPQLLSEQPPVTTLLYSPNGSCTFNTNQPFGFTYYIRAPGVDSNNVHVLLSNNSSNWVDISTDFTFTATAATLKTNAQFAITSNAPQIELLINEVGTTNACGTFLLNYTVLNSALIGQPFIQSANPAQLTCNLSQTVVLQGQNFAGVTNVVFQSQTNGFSQTLRIMGLKTNLTQTVGTQTITYDSITLQILPPLPGVAFFVLNGITQNQAQVQINVASGPGSGPGPGPTPTPTANDSDGDGIPDWLDQYPYTFNLLFNANTNNVLQNMTCLGYAGADSGYGPIVVIAPLINTGQVVIYGESMNLLGLVPTGTASVTVQFQSGKTPTATANILCQAGLYNSPADPLVFQAAINPVKPSSGTDSMTITAKNGSGTILAMLSVGVIWEINPPRVLFGCPLHLQPIRGYHSLYNRISVDGIDCVQPQYQVYGTITHDAPLNLSTLEFRLDNQDISTNLFDINTGGPTNAPYITFSLKDNNRINIYDRWNGQLSQLLSITNLVYGPHTLGVRIVDQNGKVGLAVEPFRFACGPKIEANVQNTINLPNGVPKPQPNADAAGTNAYNTISQIVYTVSQYAVSVTRGQIQLADYNAGTMQNYYMLLNGTNPPFTAQGPVAVSISGLPTYAGGAAEQFLENPPPRIFKVSTSLPGHLELPYTCSSDSGDQTVITKYRYVLDCSNPSPVLSNSVDLSTLSHPNDSFVQPDPQALGGTISVTQPCDGSDNIDNNGSGKNSGGPAYGGYGGNNCIGDFFGNSGAAGLDWWGNGFMSGNGDPNKPPDPIERKASLSPGDQTVFVGNSGSETLFITPGTYGPTNTVGNGHESAPGCIQISGSDLNDVTDTGTATLKALFPAIQDSMIAGPYIANPGNPDHYSYNMCYLFNFNFSVDGIAIGDSRGSLLTDSANYAFVPVSDPYAAIAVDAATLLASHQTPGDPNSPVVLNFNLLVNDPLAAGALNPEDFPPQVSVNGYPATSIQYVNDPTLPGTFAVNIEGQPVKYGANRLDFTVQNAVGSITHAGYFVNISDQDGLLIATPDDLYIASQGALAGTVEQSKVYTKRIFGEFPSENMQVSGRGSLMTLYRTPNVFDRFERPFYVVDSYPMEGAVAPMPEAPAMVLNPGDTGTWNGNNSVKVYAEGVTILAQDGTHTHTLPAGEITPSSFSLAAYVNANRVSGGGVQSFTLTLYTADGATIGSGSLQVTANGAGQIFDNLGQKYTSPTIQIVTNLANGSRFGLDVNGNPQIVLHSGEFVEAGFAGLTTLAGTLIKVTIDGDCNLNNDYTDDNVLEKSSPGLLVQQTDDGDGAWQTNLAKVCLTHTPNGINVGSVVLNASTGPKSGQIKAWSDNTDPSTATVLLDTTNNLFKKTWNLTDGNMGTLPDCVYVQGTQLSTNAGGINLSISYLAANGTTQSVDNLLITVIKIGLALDKNHDGIMDTTFNGPDTTCGTNPCVFWSNNNYDRWAPDSPFTTLEQDDQQVAYCPATPTIPTQDCNYLIVLPNGKYSRAIPCTRDLEDFSRLWVCGVNSNLMTLLPPNSTVTLNWDNIGYSGNPAIDLFRAADADGGVGYQINENIAVAQTNLSQNPYIGRLGLGKSIQLNPTNIATDCHFIWCGVRNGGGKLNLTITDGNGNKLAQRSAYIHIMDIKQLYERWTVGDDPNVAPTNRAYLEPTPFSPPFQYEQPQNGNTPYILHLHGYNMKLWEKDAYGETAYKRLYWQGYQGRFGVFNWPTAQKARQFGSSEAQSWASAQGLLNKLNDLNAEYPGNVYLTAHSLGNVAAGEALRLAGIKQVVNTYVAMQGAVAAHAYDPTTTANLLLFDSGTPNCYANYWTNGAPCYFNAVAGAGRYVNFFNPHDFALNKGWLAFQNAKRKIYASYTFDPPNTYFKDFYSTELFFPADTYELFDKVIQARCFALGAQLNAGGAFMENGSYHQIELDIAPYNFKDTHVYHSGEFRSDNPQRWQFWNHVLIQMGLKGNQ